MHVKKSMESVVWYKKIILINKMNLDKTNLGTFNECEVFLFCVLLISMHTLYYKINIYKTQLSYLIIISFWNTASKKLMAAVI